MADPSIQDKVRVLNENLSTLSHNLTGMISQADQVLLTEIVSNAKSLTSNLPKEQPKVVEKDEPKKAHA